VHDVSPEGDMDRLWGHEQPRLLSKPARDGHEDDVFHHKHLLARGEGIDIVDRGDGTYEAAILLRRAGAAVPNLPPAVP